MRYLQIITLEQSALSWLYESRSGLDQCSAADQHAAMVGSGLLLGRDLAEPLRDLAWDAAVVVANNRPHQERWAREQGLDDLLTSPDWMIRVLAAQVERVAPDVLHIVDHDVFGGLTRALAQAPEGHRPKLVVGGATPAEGAPGAGPDLLARWPAAGDAAALLPYAQRSPAPAEAMMDGLWDIVHVGALDAGNKALLDCLTAIATRPEVLDGRVRPAFFVDIEPGLRLPDAVALHVRPRLWGWRQHWQMLSARATLHADRWGVAAAGELIHRAAAGSAVLLAEDPNQSPLCQLAVRNLPGFIATSPADAAEALVRLALAGTEEGAASHANALGRHGRAARARQIDALLRSGLGLAARPRPDTNDTGSDREPVSRIAVLWRARRLAEAAALAEGTASSGDDAVWYRLALSFLRRAEGRTAEATELQSVLADDPRLPVSMRLDLVETLGGSDAGDEVLKAEFESAPLGSPSHLRASALFRRRWGREWLVVLGIDSNDHGGTGRLVSWLRKTLPSEVEKVTFLYAPDWGDAVLGYVSERQARTDAELLLIHPQCLGYARTTSLILGSRRPAHLYLLDSSFFCVRSYNHRPGLSSACTECVGGQFDRQQANGCEPFPIPSPKAVAYTKLLLGQARAGQVRLLAQNRAQADLARAHFGLDVPVVGMWTADLEQLFPDGAIPAVSDAAGTGPVVFHAWHLDPKGMSWTIEMARHCPGVQFLFPFAAAMAGQEAPPNCSFEEITWETGLEERVRDSRLTLVPSLWSAPIEGSLIKSIISAPAVGVARSDTAYSREIPDDVVLKLPADPREAGALLQAQLDAGWRPDPLALQRWLAEFVQTNRPMVRNLVEAVGRASNVS